MYKVGNVQFVKKRVTGEETTTVTEFQDVPDASVSSTSPLLMSVNLIVGHTE